MNPLVLLSLDWTRDRDPRVPLGHASLLAALKRDRVEVVDHVIPVNRTMPSTSDLAARLARDAGAHGVIAIGAYVWNEHVVQGLLPALRAVGFCGRIILGGPQISYAPPGVSACYPDADVFVRGHGEDVLSLLTHAPTGQHLPGVTWRGGPDTGEVAVAALERAPSPWLTGVVEATRGGLVRMETQRGCPFRCTFCQHREAGEQPSRAVVPGTRVTQELELFASRSVGEIAVLDPIFNTDARCHAVLDRLAALDFQGRLNLQCRFEMVGSRFLDATAKLNVQLEFGMQTIHAREGVAIRRTNNLASAETVIAQLHARQIPFQVTLIYGLPEQTLGSFRASVQWCLSRNVPVVRAFPLLVLRGTPLERDRARWGMEVGEGPMPLATRSHTWTPEDHAEMARISDGLRATEGHHPRTVDELPMCAPDRSRWSPAPD